MTNAALSGKPYAGNPHVRFDEGEVASVKPRRGSLLYKAAASRFLAAAAAALSIASAAAATNYIVPWYVNPGLKTKLWTGKDAFNAVDLRFGERGDRLFATFNESDKAWAIAYDMEKLATLTGASKGQSLLIQ